MTETFKLNIANIGKIDREAFTMSGVVVASKMRPKDARRIVIDDTFMTDFVKKTKGRELPVEANHNDYAQVGSKLGFIHSFTAIDNDLRADIKFLKSADKSPLAPGMVSFILDSIEEDPKSYMLSMKVAVEYFYSADNRTLTRSYNWEQGEYIWQYADNKKMYAGDVHMKIKDVIGVDFVNEGGLTNSTFSTESDTFVAQFNELCARPEVAQAIQSNFDQLIISSLTQPFRAGATPHDMNFFTFLKKIFNMNTTTPPDIDAAPPAAAVVEASTPPTHTIEQLQAQIAAMEAKFAAITAPPAPAAPAADPQAFAGEHFSAPIADAVTTKVVPLYLQNPINHRLKEKFLSN